MQPFILRHAKLAESLTFEDALTDTDPLPSTVATDANGVTSAMLTSVTKVDRETTDDK